MGSSRLFGLPFVLDDGTNDLHSIDPATAGLTVETETDEPQSEGSSDDGGEAPIVFRWPDLGTVEVRNGRRIATSFDDHATAADARNALVGICFGALLHQRGYLVLHASVVDVHGRAVAFVGPKGAGKSTGVAALLSRGHRLLADDILAVTFDGGNPQAIPGSPLFKFDPEAFDDGDLPASPSPNPDTGTGKQFYELEGGFDWDPRPLSTVTLLEPIEGDRRREGLSGHDAVMALLGHTWPARLKHAPYVETAEDELPDPNLDRLSRLVESCTVQRVDLEHDHETLAELGRDLEALLDVDEL